jgi:Predicted dehydrogenases and related proteins
MNAAASPVPLRIGFIGAGRNTIERHLPGFAAVPGVEFVAVANRTSSSAAKVASAHGIRRVEEDWRAVVSAPDVDAVCIGTWPATHAEITQAALAAGKHVLCEARMAADLAGARAMLAASAARPGLVVQIVPAPHTLAYDELARDTVRSGRLGRLRAVSVEHRHADMLDLGTPVSWRLQSRHSGVNMLTLGIFYEVLLRWLAADAEVTSAKGTLRPERRAADADLPEALLVEGRFPTLGGVPLRIELSGIESGSPVMCVTVEGEDATLRWDGRAAALTLTPRGGAEQVLLAGAPDAWRVEADFVDSIRSGAPVKRTDLATGERYMRFTAEARERLAWS